MQITTMLLVAVATTLVCAAVFRRPRAGVPDGDGWTVLHFELERARRYGHGFGLVRLRHQCEFAQRATLRCTACERPLPIRATDRAWSIGDDRYVLLLGTSSRPSTIWVQRMFEQGFSEHFEVRIADFPQDGLTAEALVEQLDRVQAAPTLITTDADDARAAS